MTTKQDVLYKLHAIAFDDDALAALDASAQKSVAQFRAGKRTKNSAADLQTMLDQAIALVGQDIALARIQARTGVDELTRLAADDNGGYGDAVKKFGKIVVHAWLNEHGVKTTKKTSMKKLNALVQQAKDASWDDEPPHQENAKQQGQVDAAAEKKVKAEREAAANANKTNGKPTSKTLTIDVDVAVTMTSNGQTFEGTLHPDAQLTFGGERFKSVSSAALAAIRKTDPSCTGATGWRRWSYMDGEKKTLIDALRVNSKGYKRGEGRRSKVVGVEGAKAEIARLEARVRRMGDSLKKASENLAAARVALTEAEKREKTQPADGSSDSQPALPNNTVSRALALKGMKAKQLRDVAKALKIKGRSKLKAEALIEAILAAEAA